LHELKTVRIPFESDQTEGIQLMGIFETRALDFDQVVILACNEGILPPSKKSNSFIPYEMRKAYELSTSDESDSTYSYLFYRLMQRAEQVVLLYNTESDVLGGGEKSRFILQLEQEWKKMTNVQMDESIFTLEAHLDQQEKPIVIAKSDEVFQQLTTYLEEKGLSPSALNTYINCSLQFYFRYLLGLGEQEEVEEEMQANTIGSAIHEALEEIYKPFLGVALQPADLQPWLQRDAGVMKLLKEHLIRRFSENNLSEGKNYLLLQVSEALIINFLKAEIARLNALHQRHQTLTVIRLEQEMRLVLQQGGRNILLKGITDRVERSEGITAIADYKTGDAVNPKLNIDDLEEMKSNPKFAKAFQLLMYAWLYDRTLNETQEPLTSGIYWLREGSKGLDTLKKNRSKAVLETQDLQAFESVLRDILGEMADRDRPFQKTEDRDRCVYCDFKRICARE
ncbi:MAG: PD-(D/E)XK nuclease family protein, partial [Chitinophagales bacterium]